MKKFIRITGVSPKFKGVQKLKPQKTPSRFSAKLSQQTADANTRKVLGDLPEFMGLSTKATGQVAAESLAIKTMDRKFFGTLSKELGRSRFRTARGVKAQPKFRDKAKIRRAKSKGALKSYKKANIVSEGAFRKQVDFFTGKSKRSPISIRSKKVPKPTTAMHDSREIQHFKKVRKDWGF